VEEQRFSAAIALKKQQRLQPPTYYLPPAAQDSPLFFPAATFFLAGIFRSASARFRS
jgi:hypothetical protein